MSDREILTVGDLRRIMAPLHDSCLVEVGIGREGYGDGISAEMDSDGDGGWLNISVEPHV